jgi:hypothetical protein
VRTRHLATSLLVLIIIGLAWVAELSAASSIQLSSETGNYESLYKFTVQNGYYQSDHSLYVSSPPSLKDYYSEKSHRVISDQDYAQFVTPDAVRSIASNIRNITKATQYGDEEFANAVLAIVREIPYVKSSAKYPVETIVDNLADCDGLSYLAASIMKAGGLDVVLLLYKGITPAHMNIGVYLERMPVSHSWWMKPSGIDYDNRTYWIAECTSLADWTVGDRPEILANNRPLVIPLENYESESSASISSSLDMPLQASCTSINLSSQYSNKSDIGWSLNISGSIYPFSLGEEVTVYVNQPGYLPITYSTTLDQFGNYILTWNVTSFGTYTISASWGGSTLYSGSDSETLTVFFSARQSSIGAMSNYFWDSGGGAQYMASVKQEVKTFLTSNLTGKEVVLSGEFIVLSNGQDEPSTETYTIPGYQRSYRVPGSRQTIVIDVPEETIVIPQIMNQFGFILERTAEDNYTASVKTLTDNDISEISQSLGQSRAMLMNASNVAVRNVWHTAVAKVTFNSVTAEVYNDNGTRLENIATNRTKTGFGELGILMSYGPRQVLVFKNLKVEAVGENQTPVGDNQAKETGTGFLYPCIRMSCLLAGAILAVVILKGRKKEKREF